MEILNIYKNKTQFMSEEVKKLTTEELQQIKDLQTQYNRYVLDLGSIEMQLNNLTNIKAEVFKTLTSLGTQEKEMATKLQEKYGVGNIDITDGTITSLPENPQPVTE